MRNIIFIIVFFSLLIGKAFSQETLYFKVDSTKTYEFDVKTLANNDLLYTHKYLTLDNKQVIVKYILTPEENTTKIQAKIDKLKREMDNLLLEREHQLEMIASENKRFQEMKSLYLYKKARRLELLNSLN